MQCIKSHFPHYGENFDGASSMFAHFPHYDENFSDACTIVLLRS